MLAIASKPLSLWFDESGTNEAASGSDQLLLTGLTSAGVVVLARRRFDWSGALRRHGWPLAMMGYMLVSTFWSDVTLIALSRWVRQGVSKWRCVIRLSDGVKALAGSVEFLKKRLAPKTERWRIS
jgi:hypothetical protein